MKQLVLFFTLIAAMTLHAQEKLSYHTTKGDIEFEISKEQYFVKLSVGSKQSMQIKAKDELMRISDSTALIAVKDKVQPDFISRKSAIKEDFTGQLEKIEPVLIYKDGIKQVCNGELILKLADNCSINDIFKGYKFNVKTDEFTKNQYLIKIEDITTQELFSLVNKITRLKRVEFAEPNFTRFLKPYTNDPLFTSQWAINNNGYLGGKVGADMDVNAAWSISTGQGIKVAIIDEGVDLVHPDLQSNILAGYDATGNNLGGAPINNDAHGTACAGIVAAVANNGIGVSGVAYNSKILPVRIAYKLNNYWKTDDSWIANGINWAVQNGADILSNSWGGGSPSATITNAINNAVVNGRNGKGCIVLVASGNNNTSVSFPATLLGVIAVGATSMCDERKTPTSCDGESWWGSNYGNEIDVVAPGVKIYTTDISGSNGYNSGDYKTDFNGTSSACPNAAGVAALVLSVNPNLTQAQTREILEKSTDKIGGYVYAASQNYGGTQTWNNEVGYGRLNAYKAVETALIKNLAISGPDALCAGSPATYSISNLPQDATVTWYKSDNLTFINENTSSSVTIQPAITGSDRAWLEATISYKGEPFNLTKKDIWIGKPSRPTFISGLPAGGLSFTGNCEESFSVIYLTNQGVSSYEWLGYNTTICAGQGTKDVTVLTPKTNPNKRISFQVSIRVGNSCGFSPYLSQLGYVGGSGGIYIAYPNPSLGEVTIAPKMNSKTVSSTESRSNEKNAQIKSIRVFDHMGNTQKLYNYSGEESVTLNLSDLPMGYYVILINGTESYTVLKK